MTNTNQEQGNAALIGIVVLALGLVVGLVVFFAMRADDTSESMNTTTDEAMQTGELVETDDASDTEGLTDEGAMVDNGIGEAPNGTATMEGDMNTGGEVEDIGIGEANMNTVLGSYEPYAPEKLAQADSADVVLFFHATWCPTCRTADKNIQASGVPEGLVILKTDYDTETSLRQKYGVTTQHSFVQVDSQGTLIKKWSGSRNVADVQAQLL